MNNSKSWEAVIGLETHVQLSTKSKIFTSASTAFGDDPNTHIDPVVCGLPGTLPVLNKKVLEYAVKTSLAAFCAGFRARKPEINVASTM